MKKGGITIKDIAKDLGMAYSTVSRALHDSYMISEATKKLVKEYAAKHNYRPNLVAQSLRSNKSRSIGLVLPAVSNTFFAEIINGIGTVAYEKDYKVIITQSFESLSKEAKILEYLEWHSIDGLIISLSTETNEISHLKKLHDKGIPMVFIDRITTEIPTHTITVDNKDAAFQVTEHLAKKGYKNIAHITSSESAFITQERLKGYRQALLANGMVSDEKYIKFCPHGGMLTEEIQNAIEELFSLTPQPDAIFTASDRITINTMLALQRRNMKIPDDIAMAGFTNFDTPEIFNPPLTTIKQPAFEMGEKAIELLIKLIEAKRPVTKFENIVLKTELKIRQSA